MLRTDAHTEFTVRAVVVYGVGQQVGHDLGDPFRIAAHFQGRKFRLNGEVTFVGQRADQSEAIGDEDVQAEWFTLQGLLTGIEPGKFEQ